MARSSGEKESVALLPRPDEPGSQVRAAREELEAACASCAERDSALRRSLLCRCPIALACRLLLRSERCGLDAALLTPAEIASLGFQERALRPIPDGWDRAQLQRALDLPILRRHDEAHGPACLACRSRALARRALGEDPSGP